MFGVRRKPPSREEKHLLATDVISKRRLPADMKDRDRFVGVRVVRSGPKGQYFQARFSIPNTLLSDFGKAETGLDSGHPQNAYIISAGDDDDSRQFVERLSQRLGRTRKNAAGRARAVIWGRGQIEKSIMRIPPLPPAWISGQGEFMLPKTGVRGVRSTACPTMSQCARQHRQAGLPTSGTANTGNAGVSITSPLPKKALNINSPKAHLSTRPRRSSRASSKRHGSSFASLRSGLAYGSPCHATSRSWSISVADESAKRVTKPLAPRTDVGKIPTSTGS